MFSTMETADQTEAEMAASLSVKERRISFHFMVMNDFQCNLNT